MNNAPLVSVVIPTYNYAQFLGEAVESALSQTYAPVEVIVMDDGSTDNTVEVAAVFGSRIRYIRGPKQGVYATRQASLEYVRGEYFLNLDADNRLHPDFVAKTLSLLQQVSDEHCVFVYTQRRHFGDGEGISHFPPFDLAVLKKRNFIDMGSLLKTNIVRRFGFDPAFNTGYGDYDFFLTLAENGFQGVLLDEPLIEYRVHGASITHSVNKTYRQVEIVKRLLKKHSPMFSAADRRHALHAARKRVLLAIINNRDPAHSLSIRIADLVRLVGLPSDPGQIWEQVKYTFRPKLTRLHKP